MQRKFCDFLRNFQKVFYGRLLGNSRKYFFMFRHLFYPFNSVMVKVLPAEKEYKPGRKENKNE